MTAMISSGRGGRPDSACPCCGAALVVAGHRGRRAPAPSAIDDRQLGGRTFHNPGSYPGPGTAVHDCKARTCARGRPCRPRSSGSGTGPGHQLRASVSLSPPEKAPFHGLGRAPGAACPPIENRHCRYAYRSSRKADAQRSTSASSGDIAYSRSPAASRALERSRKSRNLTTLPARNSCT